MEKTLYDRILGEFEIEQGIHISYAYYNTLQSLFDGLRNDEIAMIMTNRKYNIDDDMKVSNLKLQYSYGLYSETKQTFNYLKKPVDGKSGYFEENMMEEVNKYFEEIEFGDQQYESYDHMLEQYGDDGVKYLFLPFEGKEIYIENGKTLYLNYLLNDFSLDNHIFFKESSEDGLESIRSFFNDDSAGFAELVEKNRLEVARQSFSDSLILNPIPEIEGNEMIIVYSDQDSPLVIEEVGKPLGVLPTLFDMIEKMTSVTARFIHVDRLIRGSISADEVDLYTRSAYETMQLDLAKNRTELLFNNSTLIVGKAGDSKYYHSNQLAMKNVGVVNGKSDIARLQSTYEEMNLTLLNDPKTAVQQLNDEMIDYMILDEYSMLFLTISDLTNGLSVLGEWKGNSNVYLYGSSRNEATLSLVNRAMNYMDGQDVLREAISVVVENDQEEEPNRTVYFVVIAILAFTVIVSAYRGYRYRSEKRKLDYLATHDPLTKSMNLLGIKRKMMSSDGSGTRYQLLLVDVNQFKRVNNTHSYEFGNNVLIQLSKSMEEFVGVNGYVARYGSDEFAVALKYKEIDDMKVFIESLYSRLAQLLRSLIDYELPLTVGVAELNNYSLLEDAYTNAENAVNQQKENSGSGISYFNDELGAKIELDKILSKDIARGFEQKEFQLVYQPQFTKNGKEIVGSEALVRWHHPERGVLSPIKFLHLIRKENAIKKLDYYVMDHAARQLQQWNEDGVSIPKISVNITPITLCDIGFLQKIMEIRDMYTFRDQQLCIEITEDAQLVESLDLESLLNDIREIGVCVAIDDFGAGYSSLSYIVKYPVDYVKLDKSLVDNIVIRKQDYDFLKGIINVLQGLGKIIIVEGVETIGQIEKLSCFEGLFIQGYCYAKPMSPETFVQTLNSLN